jgi:integrase
VADDGDASRDLARLVVLGVGRLEETADPWEPYRLLDADGSVVLPAAEFLAELQAQDSSVSTLRSYGNDLLLWWRWLAAAGVAWDKVTPAEGRDFARWMQVADKPARPHWRDRDGSPPGISRGPATAGPAAGTVNPVTGKASPGRKFSASSRAHAETVLRRFYDFRLESGRGPIVNPFPLDRSRRRGRAHAHRNPLEPFGHERTGRYRPRQPRRLPRRIPDEQFDQIFAGLKSHRDRAMLAFWVSTGARAEELLDSVQDDVRPGDQLIAVTRKGSRAVQELPASPDAFVWLRLYQEEIWRKGAPRGRRHPLWFTLRRPFRPLTYPAARAMFTRAQQLLGTNWSIHDLRHTGAWRMARDPEMSLTDVQWVLGHAHLSTTQLYTTPDQNEVIASALAHHGRRARRGPASSSRPPAAGYNPDSLGVLFGRPS